MDLLQCKDHVQLAGLDDPHCADTGLGMPAPQDGCKKSGHPWTLPKSFPNSCPVGSFFSLQGLDLSTLQLQLSVNGEVRQQGTTSDMIFSVPELLEWVKRHFPVRPGDLLLCGTPKGVGRLSVGDAIMANISCGGKVLSQGAWDVSQ